jgi:acyl dehydratase
MALEYFEDIVLRQKRRSSEYLLEEKDIVDFAKEWDRELFHTDPEFAEKAGFGGLLASGIHLIAILSKLMKGMSPKPAYKAGLGFDELRFLVPARPGDILVVESEAISKRESKSQPNVGIVAYVNRLLNQRGEPVFTMKGTVFVEKRPKVGHGIQ